MGQEYEELVYLMQIWWLHILLKLVHFMLNK